MKRTLLSLSVLSPLLSAVASAANPPAPLGPHPRLFLTPDILTAAAANAQKTGTAAAALVKRCQETIDSPQYYLDRGGADGDAWPGAAVACAFGWVTTKNQKFLDSAIANWNAALDDDQKKATSSAASSARRRTLPRSRSGTTRDTRSAGTGRTLRSHTTGFTTRLASTPRCFRTRGRASRRGSTTTRRPDT